MSKSSLFYQLNSALMLEYILFDEKNPVQHSASTDGWMRIKDLNEKTYQIINSDTSTNTNSIRDKSSIKLSDNSWIYLDTTPAVNYLDTNTRFNYTKLDNTNEDINNNNFYNPDLDFTTHIKVINYDVVRIHVLLGYDFSDVDGFIFEILAPYNDLTNLTTSSVTFFKTDNWFTLNPRAITQNGKIYGSYIEFLVPSTRSLINDAKFSNYNVLNYINPIDSSNWNILKEITPNTFKLHRITKTDIKTVGPYNYSLFTTSLDIALSLPQKDEYQLLGCVIQESSTGDYFEYFATYDSNVIEEYMLFLINSGGNWLLQHELVISEQIGHDWFVTDKRLQIQMDSFDSIFTHRPVLTLSSSSVAYAIDYTIRLINVDKGTSVYKTSSITSTNVKKYGKTLLKIDLSRNPANLNKVYYRKNAPINMTNTNQTNSTTVVTQTLLTFVNNYSIQLGNTVLHLDSNGNFSSTSTDTSSKIYAQQELQIEIDPFDNWFLFRIYQQLQGTYVLMNLSGVSQYVLIINESLKFFSVANAIADKTKGELLFKVDQNSAAYLIKQGSGQFYINSELNGQSTVLYKGFYTKPINDYATKQIQLSADAAKTTSSVSNTNTASSSSVTSNSAVNLSSVTNPDLSVKKDTNTVEIPGQSTDDGASLKTIQPKSQQ